MNNSKPGVHPHKPGEKSLTVQEPAKDADINNIMGRAMKNRVPPTTGFTGNSRNPIYGDFSAVDFLDSLNKVQDIRNIFESLPARTRGRFNNDPHQMMRFVEDPRNEATAIKMGLLPKPDPHFNKDVMDLHDEMEAERKAREAALSADPEANPHGRKPPEGGKAP